MAHRSFRDRFLTPPVARAIMSPLGIVLFGAGTAVAIVAGAPIAFAAGVGAVAWGGRVLAAVPRNPKRDQIQPFALAEPWRSYVLEAQDAKARFDGVVRDTRAGALRERLGELADRLDDGVDESWRIAKRGDDLSAALARLDTAQPRAELAELRNSPVRSPETDETIASLEAQLASADRLQAAADNARNRLRLLDARFDELVARATEVSLGSGDSDLLGNDVDGLVAELESLRMALDETDAAERGALGTVLDVPLPPPASGTSR